MQVPTTCSLPAQPAQTPHTDVPQPCHLACTTLLSSHARSCGCVLQPHPDRCCARPVFFLQVYDARALRVIVDDEGGR